jgi:hypothetical protein
LLNEAQRRERCGGVWLSAKRVTIECRELERAGLDNDCRGGKSRGQEAQVVVMEKDATCIERFRTCFVAEDAAFARVRASLTLQGPRM